MDEFLPLEDGVSDGNDEDNDDNDGGVSVDLDGLGTDSEDGDSGRGLHSFRLDLNLINSRTH